MLLVGVYKFGYGSWVQIRDDPLLGLQNKLFLENPAAGKDATANQDGKESVKKVLAQYTWEGELTICLLC